MFPWIDRILPLIEESLPDERAEMSPERLPAHGEYLFLEEIIRSLIYPSTCERLSLGILILAYAALFVHELIKIPEASGPGQKTLQDHGLNMVAGYQ